MDDNMSNRNFDFEVITKQGEKTLFSGVDKGESQGIIAHFKNRNVKFAVVKEEANVNEEEYEDEEDGDAGSINKESQDKYEGEFIDGDNDDDEEEDEDFDPEKEAARKKNSEQDDDQEEEYDEEDDED